MELEIKGLKISHKLALILMSTALLTMSVIGFIYHQQSQATMEKLVKEHVHLLGSQIKSHLEKAVEQTNERIALISSRTQLRLTLQNINQENKVDSIIKIEKILIDAQKSIADIQYIGLYDSEKKLLIGTRPTNKLTAKTLNNLDNREKISFHENSDEELIIDTFVPLLNGSKTIGYIKILFDFSLFGEALSYKTDEGISRAYDAMLIIFNNRKARETVTWHNKFKLSPVEKLDPIVESSLSNPEFREVVVDDKRYFSNTFILPNAKLALIYKVDKEEAFALINQQIIFLSYAIIILLLTLMIVAYFTGKRISKPVVNMAFVAHHIAKGDLGKRIENIGTDELGVLGSTLNLMADNLSVANSELENRVKVKTKELISANEHLLDLSKKLEKLSLTDGLTNIANRRAFDENYHKECHRAQRDKLPLTIMMIDVDFFKKYNDCYGHEKGDQCLQKIAEKLSLVASRNSDLVARYGGEEFVLILPNTDFNSANLIAAELLQEITNLKIDHKDSQVSKYVTVSLGSVTAIPNENQNGFNFVKQADEALYDSKQSGRNKFTAIQV